MVWIPRRHRTLVYKLLVLIPVAWITIAFLLYNGNSTQTLAATELARHEQQQQQQPGAQADNSNEEIVIPPAVAIAQKPTPETAAGDNG